MMGKQIRLLSFYFFIFLIGAISVSAQSTPSTFKDFGYKGGFQISTILPTTEFESNNGLAFKGWSLRGFFRYELSHDFQAELGLGYAKLSGDGGSYYPPSSKYTTSVIPIEARLLYTPFDLQNWNPYFFIGAGALNYNVTIKPLAVSPLPVKDNGWTMSLPIGIGTEIKLADEIALDLSLSYTYTLTDNLNYYSIKGVNDGYISFGVGISFSNESMNTDKDHDGLTRGQELKLGTDPNNPDTDGDGINDGDEVLKYHTNPLKKDTDGDGLSDYDEIFKYHTDPLKVDTDGDGLSDGDEVLKYHTDPLKVDTDGDGLSDGDEVLKYHTDPLKVDTDGDGLTDGEEVLKYHTDPLKVDTDGGGVGDGVEVKRGTNPLDPSDDYPATTVDKEVTLESVHFGFNKSILAKDAKKILDSDYEALSKLPEAKVLITGHTDFIGSDKYNQKLSEKRAGMAKEYLVKKGLNEKSVTTEGFGKTKPIDPGKTAKARAKNRRAEVSAKYKEKVTK
jgi:outer membrane protein OmpA-like peptidoglycan-associated protein/opacity protein-like surface antigen